MKKVVLIFSFLFAVMATSFAQSTPTKPAGPVKKDGTADMRYKANKAAKTPPPPAHVKKDGTADKRFKENKTTKPPPPPAKKG